MKNVVKQMELKFDLVKHKYSVGDTVLKSVTECISTFFEPFNADYIASCIADRDGRTPEDVLQEWDIKRDWGTEVHELIEDHINGKQKEQYPNEVIEAINFLNTLPKANITSEKRVYSMEWGVAGTIDLVVEVPEGILLLDWKTSKTITIDNPFQKAKEPIDHLDDCNYNKYSLQLNVYKAILEKHYGKKVVAMGIVKLAKDKPFDYIPINDFSYEVELMMNHWKEKSKKK